MQRATLGRIPEYLEYLKSLDCETISATAVAKALGYGEVQVRKDLAQLGNIGRPRTGYDVCELISAIQSLFASVKSRAIVIGAGKIGRALLDYEGFAQYGIEISAAFDIDESKISENVLPMSDLDRYIAANDISIGIIAVPKAAAQDVCNSIVDIGIKAIWSFAPCTLTVPDGVIVSRENLALSLAYLNYNKLGIKPQGRALDPVRYAHVSAAERRDTPNLSSS